MTRYAMLRELAARENWTTEHLALYFDKSEDWARMLVKEPGFPAAIRTMGARHWKAAEVRRWELLNREAA